MATPTTLPASFTAGQVLTALQMNNLRGAFCVLQVLYGNYAVQTSSTTTTYADTGLTATITPSSTSSKILVIVQQGGVLKNTGNADQAVMMRLFRGATQIQQVSQVGSTNTNSLNIIGTVSMVQLDSPATTSATTYKTQYASYSNQATAAAFVQYDNNLSNIILMEISA